RAERRQIALGNPLLDFDDILFNTGSLLGAHIQTHFRATHGTTAGDLYLLQGFKTDRPEVQSLLERPTLTNGRHRGEPMRDGALQTLDLSYDGRHVLFDWCARKFPEDPGPDSILNPAHFALDNTFNVYSLDLANGELKQLTDTRYNDAAPCWLPDGRVAFISDRRELHVRCHPNLPLSEKKGTQQTNVQPCASLYSMEADGTDVVQLSWHETSEVFPRVTNDGQIVYTRWDYIDREFHAGHSIWFCMPDGRDPRSLHGNYPLPHDAFDETSASFDVRRKRLRDGRHLRPWTEYCIRPIPDSPKFLAVASLHHKSARGELVLIDPRIPDDGAMSQVKRITSEALPAENDEGKASYRGGLPYTWPFPLSEDYYLATHLPSNSLVLLDRFGNQDVLYSRPGILFAIPRRPRVRPPVVPVLTYQGKRAGAPGHQPATIGVMNVYESDFDWPQGTVIKSLRIVQIFPRPWSSPFQRVGESYMSGTINRMALGTVPVEDDGSAYFEAPVECEIYFQALDARGLAIQSMRSGTYVHPGEQLRCVGCHEDKWKAPRAVSPIAMSRPPSKIEPEAGGLEPISYYRLAKPVLSEKCVGCHREQGALLTNTEYRDIEPFAFYFHGSGGANQSRHGGYRTGAGHFGALASRMGRALLADSHQEYLKQGRFTQDDVRRITLWLDCNSMEMGSYSIDANDQARQRAGEVLWPSTDFDRQNPQRTEAVPITPCEPENSL
ncbi:MAG: hypothetical protein ACOY3P_11270, partial [Planctomycetota bacterium]